MILNKINNCKQLTEKELCICIRNVEKFLDEAYYCYPKIRKNKITLKNHMILSAKNFLFELLYTFPLDTIKEVEQSNGKIN